MDSFLRFLAFIISVSFVQSRGTIRDLKSVKLNDNIIYDCVDIYKQPSLSHPLLQNHKIQMKPSFATPNFKSQVQIKRSENIIDCPNGTVPIMRNTQKYVTNAQYFAEKHFNPLTVEKHGEHIAGVRSQVQCPFHAVAAYLSVHDMTINNDQASYANIYVGSGVNNTTNIIETGWMVNPSLFGDGRPWSYGYWKGVNGAGCYNTICPGFVQVSKFDHLSGPLPQAPPNKRYLSITITQDEVSGNWWTTDAKKDGPDIHIGYWPKELFDLIGNGVDMVGVGGVVKASSSGKSPPMGNGHLPTKNDMESARVPDMLIMDSSRKFKPHQKFELEKLLDSDKCYGLRTGNRFMFTYGGPGGDSCGI